METDSAQYLELYRYFQQRADDVKEAMFKTLTWTVGLAAALLAFIANTLVQYDAAKASVSLDAVVMGCALAGLVICLYTFFMLGESAKHIDGNWKLADYFRTYVPSLMEGFASVKPSARRSPMRVWHQLGIINGLFALAFVIVLGWHWRPFVSM